MTTTPLPDAPRAAEPAGRPEPPTARISRPQGRRGPGPFVAAALALAAAAALGAVLALDADPFGSDGGSGPLTASEVRTAASSFAAAYAHEDDGALADVLTRDVARVTPGDTQRGRAAVLREYRGQFATNSTQDYRLNGLDVRAGAAGRASGRYVASRSGAGPITGRIVLGVRREGGRPRVALIAVTPDG